MSPSNRQHGREAARRRAAHAAAREEKRRRQQRMRLIVAGVLAVVVVLAVVLATVPGGDDDDATTSATTTTTTELASTSDTSIVDEPREGAFEYGAGTCAPDRKPETAPTTFDDAPQSCLKEGADYKAVVGTDRGSFTIDLLEQRAPGTVNNFVQLAKWGWFDGNLVHRVVPGFVIQTGDPVGDPPGTGGPGYQIADELPADVGEYAFGAVAMANSGPSTNGSQWFVCIDCSQLPTAGYSLFGQVSDGMEVVEAIEALGAGDGPPSEPVTIVAVEILEDPLAEE